MTDGTLTSASFSTAGMCRLCASCRSTLAMLAQNLRNHSLLTLKLEAAAMRLQPPNNSTSSAGAGTGTPIRCGTAGMVTWRPTKSVSVRVGGAGWASAGLAPAGAAIASQTAIAAARVVLT
jgi:hypothetical protein